MSTLGVYHIFMELFAGLDVGSTATKAVVVDGRGRIVSSVVIPTSSDLSASGARAFEKALKKAGAERVSFVVATGYGRKSIPFRDASLTEITCQAVGIRGLGEDFRTVIDIGGQDSKVIVLDEEGRVEDFRMNDKCAAGTGRFLEVMAERLGMDVVEFGRVSLLSESPQEISSVCTVFAESEVVSLLSSGARKVDVVAGIHKAIAQRVGGMCKALGLRGKVVLTGGVARNPGVRFFLEKVLGRKVYTPKIDPSITCAYGASLMAIKMARKL